MNKQNIDRSKISFSQAEGIEPLPQPMALEELSKEIRNLLWSCIYQNLRDASRHYTTRLHVGQPWKEILHDCHVQFMHRPVDEFNNDLEDWVYILKPFFQNADYNRIFDFLQFVLRHDRVPNRIYASIKSILEDCLCAYAIVEDGPTIIPIAIPEQRESVEKSFQVLSSESFDGARTHLRESAQHINEGDYAGSIRESIHSVESIARCLHNGTKSGLSDALKALAKKGITIHGAFESGINSLYGYTSDENGIRHSLLDEHQANVDMEDAVFMFGACASFCAYLVNKARKAGLLGK